MNKRITVIIIVLIFVVMGIYITYTKYVNKKESTSALIWNSFSKWYEWKKTTGLNEAQQNVITYFGKADKVKNLLRSDNYRNLRSEEAINIINKNIELLRKYEVPKPCIAYHDALLKELEIELEYQEAKKAGASIEKLQSITIKISSVDGREFTAFFEAIEAVGLTKNMDKELENMQKHK